MGTEGEREKLREREGVGGGERKRGRRNKYNVLTDQGNAQRFVDNPMGLDLVQDGNNT